MSGSPLDKLSGIPVVHRIVYEGGKNNKPNDHCNWELIFPTYTSEYGWVENDAHLRKRIKANA